jgi:hypothetical protein
MTETPAQRRRRVKKAQHDLAGPLREQEAKVARLRGAAKASAQKTLDKMRQEIREVK